MTPIATGLVNWSDLWKIVLTALVGGTGVVIVFGLLLLGISRGKTATNPGTRYGLLILSGLCGVLVVAVAAVGVYAITQKPSSTKPKRKTAAAMLAPASVTQQRAAVSSRTVAAWHRGALISTGHAAPHAAKAGHVTK